MKTLKTLLLKVEPFVGSDIRDTACDMCELSNRVGMAVGANFNDVNLMARPGDNPLKLVEVYESKLAQNKD